MKKPIAEVQLPFIYPAALDPAALSAFDCTKCAGISNGVVGNPHLQSLTLSEDILPLIFSFLSLTEQANFGFIDKQRYRLFIEQRLNSFNIPKIYALSEMPVLSLKKFYQCCRLLWLMGLRNWDIDNYLVLSYIYERTIQLFNFQRGMENSRDELSEFYFNEIIVSELNLTRWHLDVLLADEKRVKASFSYEGHRFTPDQILQPISPDASSKYSLIHLAAWSGSLAILEIISTHSQFTKAINFKDLAVYTAFSGVIPAIKYGINNPHIDRIDLLRSAQSLLHNAARSDSVETLKYVRSLGLIMLPTSSPANNTLLSAASTGCVNTMFFSAKFGNKPYSINMKGQNALHHAAASGLVNAIHCAIELGISVTTLDHEGHDALYHAATSGSVASMKCLKDHYNLIPTANVSYLSLVARSGSVIAIQYILSTLSVLACYRDKEICIALAQAAQFTRITAIYYLRFYAYQNNIDVSNKIADLLSEGKVKQKAKDALLLPIETICANEARRHCPSSPELNVINRINNAERPPNQSAIVDAGIFALRPSNRQSQDSNDELNTSGLKV